MRAFEAAVRAESPRMAAAGLIWVDGHGRVVDHDVVAERLLGEPIPSGTWITQLELDLDSTTWTARVATLVEGPLRVMTRLHHRERAVDVVLDLRSPARAPGPLAALANEPGLVAMFVHESSEDLALRHRLEDAETRWALVASGANEGLWHWNLDTNEVHFAPRWAALMGFSEASLVGPIETWLERIHPADRPAVDALLAAHLDGRTDSFESEHRLEHKNGSWRWVLMRGIAHRDAHGRLRHMAGSTSDITHRKNAEERLRYEAFHDPLTGLGNRAWLIHRLQDAVAAARESRDRPAFALVIVGVDGFKLVNDSFGPSLGDLLLRAIAARIARCVRSVDTVARIGGDEFVMLLDEPGEHADVVAVAERIQRDLAQPFDLRGYAVYSSVSLGIVPGRADYGEPEEVLRDANIVLVRAKKLGRGKRVTFDESMRHETIRRLMLETDLRRALERAELRLAYQPVVSLDTGRLLGFEALCRWSHAKHGIISPDEFIPLAEESGLIHPIGRWALREAMEDALAWPTIDGAPLWVAVNVSGRQLGYPVFVDEVRQLLTRTGLPPSRLHLEITESVLMENAEASREVLERLRGLGVALSIDDFGTGYSSLAYLRKFPIETLKIDRAFLARDADTEDSWAIIKTIRSLAHVLGLGVVVEGVETIEHARRLRDLGCQAAQGYLLSRPIPADDVEAWIASLDGGVVGEFKRRLDPA
ncbi:MAG: EAL domain-containing protein [Deltaproteobacteria bacterium]|nr:EAL domain-containing protein [Deltaproteobacteria bacterium]